MKASPLPLWLAGLGCLLGVLVAWTSLPAAQIGGKMPVPDTAAQTAAEALVKRILGDDYKRVGADAAAVEKWILTLRQQAADTKEEAVRFVLLREARDLAARVGDVVTALRVVGELAEEYAIDEPAMSADVLRLAAPAAKTLRMKQTLARAALDLLNRFLDADNPDAALSVAPTAEAAAAASDSLRLEVATRLQEARLLQKERGRIKEFADKLKRSPDDAEANLRVGKYHLLRGDWARGLPLLARGTDGDWKTLARRDLDAPTEARQQLELADAWRQLVQGKPDLLTANLLLRAGFWYQQALLRLDEEERLHVEEKLRSVAEALPAGRQIPGYLVLLRRFEGHQGNVTGVAFAHDGRRALTASADRTLRLWDVHTGKQRKRIDAHDNWVRCVAFAPDVEGGGDRRALSAGDDNLLRLWDVTAGREVRRFKGHTEWVRCAAFLPDGRRVVSGSDDGTLRLWDVDTAKELKRFSGHKGYVMSLAVSGDGRRLLSGGADESVRLWDVDSGKELGRFAGHRGSVNTVALSPDGRRVLSGGADGTVRLWDARGRELRRFSGHEGSVWAVAFAPDGRLALSGGADRTARLWDITSGREVRRLLGHSALVLSVAFAPDGRVVLTGSADKTARLWGPPR